MDMLVLSEKALKELQIALRNSYGEDFGKDLTDEQFNNLGNFFLTCISEVCKYEMQKDGNN